MEIVHDAIDLTFISRPAKSTARGLRPAYPESADFRMPWWVGEDFDAGEGLQWFSVYEGSEEVARFLLEPRHLLSTRFEIAIPEGGFLEIVFLEVSNAKRRTGVGTRTVRQLVALHDGTRLMVISQDESSDRFWNSVGWQRHEHPVFGKVRPIYLALASSET